MKSHGFKILLIFPAKLLILGTRDLFDTAKLEHKYVR